jgi:hypothetical protein
VTGDLYGAFARESALQQPLAAFAAGNDDGVPLLGAGGGAPAWPPAASASTVSAPTPPAETEYEPPQEKEEAPTVAAPDLYPTWTPR